MRTSDGGFQGRLLQLLEYVEGPHTHCLIDQYHQHLEPLMVEQVENYDQFNGEELSFLPSQRFRLRNVGTGFYLSFGKGERVSE